MICYFQKGLRSLVQVEIKQCGQKLNSFEEIVKKLLMPKPWPTLVLASILATPINPVSRVVSRQQLTPIPRPANKGAKDQKI